MLAEFPPLLLVLIRNKARRAPAEQGAAHLRSPLSDRTSWPIPRARVPLGHAGEKPDPAASLIAIECCYKDIHALQ